MKNLCSRSGACVLLLAAANAWGQTSVTVTASHARAAARLSEHHEARCDDGSYRIEIARWNGRVTLHHEGDTRSSTDLSQTGFGATFGHKAVYGAFGFSCWNPGGVNLSFFGVELQKGAPAKPVSYRVTIRRDGAIVTDSGLQPESQELVNSHLIASGGK
jgi:hypothetical protein